RSRAPPASRLQQTPAHPRNGESVRGLGCAARGIQPRLRAAARKGRSPQITGGQRRRPGVRRSHSPLAVAARLHSGPRRSNASHGTHSAIDAPCHPERSRGTSLRFPAVVPNPSAQFADGGERFASYCRFFFACGFRFKVSSRAKSRDLSSLSSRRPEPIRAVCGWRREICFLLPFLFCLWFSF